MKRTEAIIKPFKLEEAKLALADVGVAGMFTTAIQEAAGTGKIGDGKIFVS